MEQNGAEPHNICFSYVEVLIQVSFQCSMYLVFTKLRETFYVWTVSFKFISNQPTHCSHLGKWTGGTHKSSFQPETKLKKERKRVSRFLLPKLHVLFSPQEVLSCFNSFVGFFPPWTNFQSLLIIYYCCSTILFIMLQSKEEASKHTWSCYSHAGASWRQSKTGIFADSLLHPSLGQSFFLDLEERGNSKVGVLSPPMTIFKLREVNSLGSGW